MDNKAIAVLVLSYLAIGSMVAIWTATLSESGEKAFAGFGDAKPSNATILTQCILAWPIVAVKNVQGMQEAKS